MVFALETQHGKTHQWGVRIEEMLIVHKDRVEIISNFPVEQITVVDPMPGYSDFRPEGRLQSINRVQAGQSVRQTLGRLRNAGARMERSRPNVNAPLIVRVLRGDRRRPLRAQGREPRAPRARGLAHSGRLLRRCRGLSRSGRGAWPRTTPRAA